MKEKSSEFRFNFVPSYIVRAWSEDGRNVRYNTAYDDRVFSSPIEDMYVETLRRKGDADPDYTPSLFSPSLVKAVTRLSSGDPTGYVESFFDVLVFVMEEYLANPNSYGRFCTLMAEEVKKRGKMPNSAVSAEQLSQEAVRKMNRERTTEELAVEMHQGFLFASYILDLTPLLVKAHDALGFLLSAYPLLYGNPYNRAAFNDLDYPYARKGAVFFMPVSPEYALCLYDSDVYFVNSKNGTLTLSREDTLLLASYAINVSDNIIFRPDRENYYRSFKAENFHGFYDVSSFDPSFLKIKRSLPFVKNVIRKLPSALMDYDERKSEVLLSDYEAFINERSDYALSLLAGKRRPF